MLKFREASKCVSGSIAVSTCPKSLIARRYTLQQKLGSGSFGTVYLVSDKKAKQGEELKILHRDLKSKNIFLKNNKLKIGDFGVSRLLMGSCDLATTLTGTPHYMSPEALKHQGYDTKSDIWSLACILYEMCCMNHAFTGSNFLSIVLKIVEGDTPSLPERYPRQLNAIMESMLNKSPSLRPSAIEILKLPYIDEQLQIRHSDAENLPSMDLMCRYSEMALEDKNLNSQEEAAYIINAVQKKIHLQTLRALSEVQKMTPRERMRVRKVQAADEEARKLKKLVEEKYEENNKRMQELRLRNFQRQTVDVLHECDDPASDNLPESQPIPSLDLCTLGSNVEDTIPDLGDHGMNLHQCSEGCSWMTEIPEDPLVAEEYYADVFDSCSEESEESEEGKTVFSVKDEEDEDEGPQPVYRTNQQDSDTEALARCLEHVLGCTTLDTRTATSSAPDTPSEPTIFNSAMARTRMKHMRESAVQKLGAEVFEEVYSYLKRARQRGASEAEVWAALETVVPRASDCFEVDQLLYFEEQLLITRAEGVTLPQNHHEATVRSKQVPVDKAPVKIHQHCC
ncbi:serine/threonine-protein kinase Nek11 isoform X11 [Bubalus bubalis]|uniref:serine/threonine-protein kinase Nek11 isoform X11 n=1 Tax=Bubalus bubalis TaxID=89462 RepID=UPI001E1B8F16|nr:serine/threonine-protein kinase Nek11 isoform X11 [Bubalus bubalis]